MGNLELDAIFTIDGRTIVFDLRTREEASHLAKTTLYTVIGSVDSFTNSRPAIRFPIIRRAPAGFRLRGPLYPPGGHLHNRLLDIAEGKVTFRYKDYRHNAQQKTMTLEAGEFIRRFLLHVLPEGFQRIRYYGFLANRYRVEKLAHCRELLDMPAPEPPTFEAANDYRERYEELTGSSLRDCPVCHQGHMLLTQILPPSPHTLAAITDTS